jgi:chromosome segregation ATPase
MELKAKSYVIFENSNNYDRGCNFTFKVQHDHVAEVLAWINDLDPKRLSENTYTIKRQIDDFTSEEEILRKKRDSIDETLRSATAAYEEVTRLATQTRDAGSLAEIISSRIDIIERLTQERININEQLDRLSRAKADQLDRMEYTYFHVDVAENKYVDLEAIRESWKQSIRDTVFAINQAIQGVTINLIGLFFILIQYALYALILLVIAKYGWQIALYLWRR